MPRKKTPRISEEERAEVNRRNGRMSKGPTSEAGKIRASRNALKTGCQATVHHLDSEDPALIRARYALWELHYQPESPADYHLLNENVRATLRLDRCEAATQSLVNTQLADASTDWRRAREQDIKDLSCVLAFDPALHLRELRASSMGCDWLVSRWEFLGGRVERNGAWSPVETAEAFLLLGCFPEEGDKRWDPIQFLADAGYVYGELAILKQFDVRQSALDSLKPKPPRVSLKGALGAAWLADPAVTAGRLKQEVAMQLTRLKAESARLWLEVDEPSRARAVSAAQVIRDEATAKRLLRYRVEAKSAFHASLKELEKTLEKDKERTDDWRDRLEELQRSTGFLVEPAADVAAEAEDVAEAAAEGTLGSLPAGPGASGSDVPNGTSTDVKICEAPTPAGTLGSRGSDSRNEPNVPGPVGRVGPVMPPVPTLPFHPGPDGRGGGSRTSRGWGFAPDEGGSKSPTRRGPVEGRGVGRVDRRWAAGRETDRRPEPDPRPSPAAVAEPGTSSRRE
jgi:hypothetical protein